MAAVLGLLVIGALALYSTTKTATVTSRISEYLFRKQMVLICMGLCVLVTASLIDYRILLRYAWLLMLCSVILLVVVLFERPVRGARRALILPYFSLQPVEVAKVAMIIYLSDFLSRKGEIVAKWKGVVVPILTMGICSLLVLKQPDLGSTVILASVTMLMLFVGGVRYRYLIPIILLGVGAVSYKIASGYQMERVVDYVKIWKGELPEGQAKESLLALGSGGLFGVGLCESRQKLFYLPEARTDFIASIIGEELGFAGMIAIVSLFCLVVWSGFRIAGATESYAGGLLAVGLSSNIALQALLNLAAVTVLVPPTGMVLPFISRGGSSLLALLGSVGILLNVGQHQGTLKQVASC